MISIPVTDAPRRAILSDNNPPPHPISKHLSLFNGYVLFGSLYLDTTDNMGVQQYNVVRAFISYIKYPNRVFIGGYDHIDKHSTSSTEPIHCDLDESFHDEIVRIAVNLSQSSVQDMQGYQISTKQVSDDNNF